MADDKKNILEVDEPVEATTPTTENPAVTEPPAPEPVLTDAEALMLEHEGQAALFEMGEAVPDPADAVNKALFYAHFRETDYCVTSQKPEQACC